MQQIGHYYTQGKAGCIDRCMGDVYGTISLSDRMSVEQ